MFKGYFEKLKETRKEMFEISLGMKDMFDHAIACEDEKVVDEIIKDIKKIQKKCYRIIDKKHINDYHGGTYRCYPGGEVDVYRPHTDKQNIVDYIDYFFINTVSSADEFNEKFSPQLHEHEYGESSGLYDYVVDKSPKNFYDANCWEQILRKQAKELIATDGKGLTQEKIEEINQEYGVE